ncbi:MAG: hypothetical protein ACYCXN_03600 [Acidimicrobiales bacterium]
MPHKALGVFSSTAVNFVAPARASLSPVTVAEPFATGPATVAEGAGESLGSEEERRARLVS